MCTKCGEGEDLSLIDYTRLTEVEFTVTFQCRQCGETFTVELTEAELNYYR